MGDIENPNFGAIVQSTLWFGFAFKKKVLFIFHSLPVRELKSHFLAHSNPTMVVKLTEIKQKAAHQRVPTSEIFVSFSQLIFQLEIIVCLQ
jgi:hypothetical protein